MVALRVEVAYISLREAVRPFTTFALVWHVPGTSLTCVRLINCKITATITTTAQHYKNTTQHNNSNNNSNTNITQRSTITATTTATQT
jgi:hypothetical protein